MNAEYDPYAECPRAIVTRDRHLDDVMHKVTANLRANNHSRNSILDQRVAHNVVEYEPPQEKLFDIKVHLKTHKSHYECSNLESHTTLPPLR